MTLERGGGILRGVKGNKQTLVRVLRVEERPKWRQGSRKQVTIDVVFKILEIVIISEARSIT